MDYEGIDMSFCLLSQKCGPFYLAIYDGGYYRYLYISPIVLSNSGAVLEGRRTAYQFMDYAKNNWDHFSPYITPSELVRKVEESYKMGEKTL